MAVKAEILEVLMEAIEGLVRADALRLAGLVAAARESAGPATERERMEAVRLHRAFGRLLVLTRRNLRLLGSARELADTYELEAI
jgi:hypothetical protein